MKAEILTREGVREIDLNRRKAIKLKCLDCSGFEHNEVTNCHHLDCSLYPFRTGKEKQNAKERDKAIRSLCMWCTLDQHCEINLCPSINCPLYCFRGYTRGKKSIVPEKVSYRGIPRHDFPSAIPEHQPRENTLDRLSFMNK